MQQNEASSLVDALLQIGPGSRGVATIGPDTTTQDIEALDRAGVRGARINLAVSNTNDPAAASRALVVEQRIPPSWHMHISAEMGPDQPGLADILALLHAKKVVVKLSGPYQTSRMAGYEDVQAMARLVVEAAPDQVIWGSDWPHTGGTHRPGDQSLDVIEAFRQEDDRFNFDLLGQWIPNPATRQPGNVRAAADIRLAMNTAERCRARTFRPATPRTPSTTA